ncbi:MAG: ABC transporter ATP-binding protein [Coleofasciculaceae cyanobacterium SM2_1_6]|nr:ABC transporter ATP-binding protein [Coleofasciculaceae cyanobacterium SM2_1_6]
MSLVTLKNISKIYPSKQGSVYAVEDVNLEIQAGEFYSLLGSSGSGKTTILRVIGGFEIPEQGRVFLGEEDVTQQPPYQRNVHTVFQKYALFPHMTVTENIAYPLTVAGVIQGEIDQRVTEAIETFRLQGLADRQPSQLSGGQQQRVALARALIDRPKVLLLDEPLSALDAKIRQEVRQELRELQKLTSITFIYVTHDQEEALALSDRIAVMHDGKVEQIGTPSDIYNQPASLFVAKFIGKANLLTGKIINSRTVDINGYVLDIPELSVNLGDLDSLDNSDNNLPNSEQQIAKEQIARKSQNPSDQVTVMIRPERLQINPRTLRDQEITGKIVNCTYIGQTREYQVQTSMGLLIITKLATGTDYAIDSIVEISWSTEDCVVLFN